MPSSIFAAHSKRPPATTPTKMDMKRFRFSRGSVTLPRTATTMMREQKQARIMTEV
ncbi:hypothetical protein [Paratractidigestivibacter sp.]|uniref:hypothetical protein n=1 Tax=Paratractidigestivibacter sp. TaxID=2847316 RepID=UPI002ABE3B5C|nr:hypothetical protein [Paratractidigestivibacter sp.]